MKHLGEPCAGKPQARFDAGGTGEILPFTLPTKMFGVSLAALGAHFLGYLIYAYLTGSLGLVMLWEVWAIPLLGLGASLFYEAVRKDSLSS